MGTKQIHLENFKIQKPVEYKDKLPKGVNATDKWYAEPKYDGLRGIIIKDGTHAKAYTSSGVLVPNAVRLCRVLDSLEWDLRTGRALHIGSGFVLDGEFFCKDWNKTSSIVKTQSMHKDYGQLRFRAFDYIPLDEWQKRLGVTRLKERKKWLKQVMHNLHKYSLFEDSLFEETPHKLLPLSEIRSFMLAQAKLGFEGCVFKDPESVYQFKKNGKWLKLKPFFESDMVITGIEMGNKGKAHEGTLGRIKVTGKIDGKTVTTLCDGFDVKTRHQLYALHLKGQLVGKVVEIKHEGITVENKVRFPKWRRMRWDKMKP